MHKYPAVSTTKDNLIPHRIDSTTIRPVQKITSNHINLSDYSTIASSTSNQLYYYMPLCRAINFTHVNCNYDKCRGRTETTGHYYSCPYPNEKDIGLTSEDNYKVIKKEDKKVSSDEEPLASIVEELFGKYKAPSTNIYVTGRYNNLWIVPSGYILLFRFTTSGPVTIRNKF